MNNNDDNNDSIFNPKSIPTSSSDDLAELNEIENSSSRELPQYANDVAPRFDLREPAFRKYEPYILRAIEYGTFTIDPANCFIDKHGNPKNIKPKTFCVRFTDALLGWRRYKYTSTIPKNYPLNLISALELNNGKVKIINTKYDQDLTQRVKYLSVNENWDLVVIKVKELVERYARQDYPNEYTYFTCVSDEEFKKLEQHLDPTELTLVRYSTTLVKVL